MSFPFNFRPMDEEEFRKLQAAHIAHHERAQLESQEFVNRWIRMIDELSPEDKRTFMQWLQRMDSAEYGLVWLNYWQGVVVTALRMKHPDFCMNCGRTHDQIADPCQDIYGMPVSGPNSVDLSEHPETQAVPDSPDIGLVDPSSVEAEYNADLKLYNLVPYTKKNEDDTRSGFECGNCQQFYSSLAERMLRDPGECPGCQQKAKWG